MPVVGRKSLKKRVSGFTSTKNSCLADYKTNEENARRLREAFKRGMA